jgi:hypothetical protein
MKLLLLYIVLFELIPLVPDIARIATNGEKSLEAKT